MSVCWGTGKRSSVFHTAYRTRPSFLPAEPTLSWRRPTTQPVCRSFSLARRAFSLRRCGRTCVHPKQGWLPGCALGLRSRESTLLVIPPRLALPWVKMSMAIVSETIIADGVTSPISMVSFPSMETLPPEWFTDQPDVAGSQIDILVTNDPDVFVTIPDVSFRNHYWFLYHRWRTHIRWLRSDIYRLGSRNDDWSERYPAIWLNHTARHQH